MLLILRHGETRWNREGRMQGGLNSPLTEHGIRQARMFGPVLEKNGARRLPVYCCPQGRALTTAELALPGLPIRENVRLAEVRLGEWQRLTRREIAQSWPSAGDDPHGFRWKCAAPGGEGIESLLDWVGRFALEIRGPAVVVTRSVTSQVLRGLLLGLDVAGMVRLADLQGVVNRVKQGKETISHGSDDTGTSTEYHSR